MTESEWLACEDPEKMLEHLQGRVSPRKLRLFACACARRVWHLLGHEDSRRAVEVAELYADGRASERDRAAARTAALIPTTRDSGRVSLAPYWAASRNVSESTSAASVAAAEAAMQEADRLAQQTGGDRVAAMDEALAAAARAQAELLREIVGNAFRRVALEPGGLAPGGVVAQLARAIYEERRWEDLPILADALEEGGCDDAEVLAHLRGPGPHVLGCWVVDLLLGKR